jgi:hypothetical protein
LSKLVSVSGYVLKNSIRFIFYASFKPEHPGTAKTPSLVSVGVADSADLRNWGMLK